MKQTKPNENLLGKICGKTSAINHRHGRRSEKVSWYVSGFGSAKTWYFHEWWLMVIYSCRFCSQSSEDCPSFYSRRKGTWRVSVFNSAVLTPHLLNRFLFTLHLIGGIFSFTMFMGWWIQINIFSTPLFSISKWWWLPTRKEPQMVRARTHNVMVLSMPWFLLLRVVINWISSFETGSFSLTRFA